MNLDKGKQCCTNRSILILFCTFSFKKRCLAYLNMCSLVSSGVPLQNLGYGYSSVPGGYAPTLPAPGGHSPVPGGYAAPPLPNGPYPYAPPPVNAYGPAPQPMGYPYAQTPGLEVV